MPHQRARTRKRIQHWTHLIHRTFHGHSAKLAIALYLASRVNRSHGFAYPDLRDISDSTVVRIPHVSRALTVLEKLGFIRRHPGSVLAEWRVKLHHRRKVYTLTLPSAAELVSGQEKIEKDRLYAKKMKAKEDRGNVIRIPKKLLRHAR